LTTRARGGSGGDSSPITSTDEAETAVPPRGAYRFTSGSTVYESVATKPTTAESGSVAPAAHAAAGAGVHSVSGTLEEITDDETDDKGADALLISVEDAGVAPMPSAIGQITGETTGAMKDRGRGVLRGYRASTRAGVTQRRLAGSGIAQDHRHEHSRAFGADRVSRWG